MSINTKRGFTLMELLVVIAIIGILASVVLASLNSARSKGADAAVKSNLNNSRAQAELFYDSSGNSYLNVCTAGTNNISTMVSAAQSANGALGALCNSTATAWAAAAGLPASTTGAYYCVDSTGASKTNTGVVGTDFVVQTICP